MIAIIMRHIYEIKPKAVGPRHAGVALLKTGCTGQFICQGNMLLASTHPSRTTQYSKGIVCWLIVKCINFLYWNFHKHLDIIGYFMRLLCYISSADNHFSSELKSIAFLTQEFKNKILYGCSRLTNKISKITCNKQMWKMHYVFRESPNRLCIKWCPAI